MVPLLSTLVVDPSSLHQTVGNAEHLHETNALLLQKADVFLRCKGTNTIGQKGYAERHRQARD